WCSVSAAPLRITASTRAVLGLLDQRLALLLDALDRRARLVVDLRAERMERLLQVPDLLLRVGRVVPELLLELCALRGRLELAQLDSCPACLSFVAFPLRAGDDREVRRAVASVTPHLWEEGLALPAVAALERARRAGVPHADAALADIGALGSRSRVVREI